MDTLNIRHFKKDDLQALYELLSDEEVMRYIEPPYSFPQTETFLQSAGLALSPLIYAVETANRDFVGYVIYHDYDEESKEIGWVLRRAFWGRGYAGTLTKQLIEKAYAEGKSAVLECSPTQRGGLRWSSLSYKSIDRLLSPLKAVLIQPVQL